MLKLTKKADYGLIALRHLANRHQDAKGALGATASEMGKPLTASAKVALGATASAKDIADAYRIPLPLLSKVLQTLVRNGLLVSEQGASGGYRLARDPHEISALEVIRSIDGPIILTHCFTEHAPEVRCDQSELCPVREPLRKVHEGILRLLSSITISDMASDDMPIPSIPSMVSSIQRASGPAPRT